MASRDERFLVRLTTDLTRAAARHVRPLVRLKSRTLANAIQVVVTTTGFGLRGRVYIPHYWAIYVHDGRQPFSTNRVMVWFRNPNNDPRLRGGRYPERVSQVRRLTRVQFEFWLAENRLARARGIEPPMIVTKRINKPTQAAKFFENTGGMAGFLPRAHDLAAVSFSDHVLRTLDADGSLRVKDTATCRL